MAKPYVHQGGQTRNCNGQVKRTQPQTVPPSAEQSSIFNLRLPSKRDVKATDPARLVGVLPNIGVRGNLFTLVADL